MDEAVVFYIISVEQRDQLRDVLIRNIGALGISQSVCRMSDLEPMEITLKEGSKPFKSVERTMGPLMLSALRQKLQDLSSMGMVKRNPNCLYSSVVMMVPKKNGTPRMVVDLRQLNKQVQPVAVGLPNLEMQLSWLPAGIQYFGSLDCLSGFDMLKTKEECTKFCGISTPFGTYRLMAAPMGLTITNLHRRYFRKE